MAIQINYSLNGIQYPPQSNHVGTGSCTKSIGNDSMIRVAYNKPEGTYIRRAGDTADASVLRTGFREGRFISRLNDSDQ